VLDQNPRACVLVPRQKANLMRAQTNLVAVAKF
jgi:hypothetical protein